MIGRIRKHGFSTTVTLRQCLASISLAERTSMGRAEFVGGWRPCASPGATTNMTALH